MPGHRAGIALPGVVVHPVDDALEVEDLPADVPLDREILGWDRVGEPRDLPCEEVLVGGSDDREVAGEVVLEAGRRTRAEREAELEAHVCGDDALVAQRTEHRVGLDAVVDAWPAVEAQLVDIWLDAEHGDLLDVAGRRAAGPRDLDVRMRVQQADELVGRPQGARAGLAVRQREHQIAEQLAAGAQRLIRRGRRKASDEQQFTVDSAGHDSCLLRRAPRPGTPDCTNTKRTVSFAT